MRLHLCGHAWRDANDALPVFSVLALLRGAVTLYRRDEQPQANDPRVDEFLPWLAPTRRG
jgi:hypothetical protein